MRPAATTSVAVVEGMTCEHCRRAVTDELTKLPGVAVVDVDLAAGRVTIRSESPLDDASVRVAVDEAGYTLTSYEVLSA